MKKAVLLIAVISGTLSVTLSFHVVLSPAPLDVSRTQISNRIQSQSRSIPAQFRLFRSSALNYAKDEDNELLATNDRFDDGNSRTFASSQHNQHIQATKRSFRRKQSNTRRKAHPSSTANIEWLENATESLLGTEPGSLTEGKWHQVVSLFTAWSVQSKRHEAAPLQMECLLKRLVEERRAGNTAVEITIDMYNTLLDAWACSALFRMVTTPERASQRAREILVLLQENYESGDSPIAPDETSFGVVLHCVCRTEGALMARRLLAWMEYLTKSGRNLDARPSRSDYLMILDCYANDGGKNAATLAEGFIRHMNTLKLQQQLSKDEDGEDLNLPDTYCYNVLLKAWNKQVGYNKRGGREAAENADRIIEEMKASNNPNCKPDLITYSTAITAWAASGMKAHAVSRAEDLLREIEESPDIELNTVVLNAAMSAWVKSRNPNAVSRTEEILRQMEGSEVARPDLISYNTHLHALSIHAHKRPQYAQRAEMILEKLEDGVEIGILDFGPNTFTYNLAIESVCRASPDNAMKAALILRKLIKRKDVEPDSYSFNQVLTALSRSSSVGSAKTAEELLKYMNEAHCLGLHPNAKPNSDSYVAVICAHSRSCEKGAAERAEALFTEMKNRYAAGERDMKPTRAAYNAMIDCWAKSGEGTLGARKAEALLQEMHNLCSAGDESMSPTLVTFNSVLNAWARSGTRCCGYKAEQYLQRMWDMYNAGEAKVKPNDFSYNTVINAISKSKNEGKAQKALRILRKMDKLYQSGINKEARPNEITYTAVLNSCAFPAALDSKTRRKALDTAMFTLKELQDSRYGQPNQVTYGTFIRACRNLLDDDDDLRRIVIKRALEECIEDGQMGPMVLNYIPRDLVEELMQDRISSGGRISIQDVPAEWRCNVRARDSWNTKPYSGGKKNPRRYSKGKRSSNVENKKAP